MLLLELTALVTLLCARYRVLELLIILPCIFHHVHPLSFAIVVGNLLLPLHGVMPVIDSSPPDFSCPFRHIQQPRTSQFFKQRKDQTAAIAYSCCHTWYAHHPPRVALCS